ncbi:hypothetical protein RISK_001526 [Rhodopirellula islandica]|uniref:DUF1573 domain-containing protein n=1 Tax=Rhodopirellula islandica TaxID=595434 RepID=A0A0J1BIE8_RHOIS|nr:DUF1573 domain-containing protein [Rhodopirellula islandica]KLU06315.1 hypothetical protein RISK_001526 [Rhodopirellula islandica]
MNTRIRIAFLLALVSSCCMAQDRAKHKTLAVSLRQTTPFNVQAACDVDLSIATDNVVRLELSNETGGIIYLGNPETSCGCVGVETAQSQLRPGESCEVVVKLRPDGNYAKHVWVQRITFPPPKGKEGRTASLVISSKLRGLLAFNPTSLVLIASSLESQADEPVKTSFKVLYSSPNDPENFEFSGSPWINLLDIDQKKPLEDGVAEYVVQAKSSEIPIEGTHGHLQIKDKRTGDFRVLRLSMVRRPPIRIVPSILVFRESREAGKMEAYALLIRESSSETDRQAKSEQQMPGKREHFSSETPVHFTATIGRQSVEARVLSGAESFRRVHLSMSVPDSEELLVDGAKPVMNWRALWGDLSVNEQSDVLFPSIPKGRM